MSKIKTTIVCINNKKGIDQEHFRGITESKHYIVEGYLMNNKINKGMYLIIDDDNRYLYYNENRFITLEEHREQILNQLDI